MKSGTPGCFLVGQWSRMAWRAIGVRGQKETGYYKGENFHTAGRWQGEMQTHFKYLRRSFVNRRAF